MTSSHDSRAAKAEKIGQHIARFPRQWRAVLDSKLAPLGLTQTRWVTLYCLAKGGEGAVQRELAAIIGVEAPSLVRTLDQLAEQGLIERRQCGDDRRSKRVYLTANATPLIKKMETIVRTTRMELLQGLDDEDIDTLINLIDKLDQNCAQLLDHKR
ncbi:transcriptional regulator SlyA [Carnimonas nigrificans]|uniref:transcriptional regulator SlyA n=1 Tax=Carnimonas nigrificans TaxID=64323 RepID=UPI000470ADA3|nr:transcriptional regulator SlyA [Carnimonas nigrificans]